MRILITTTPSKTSKRCYHSSIHPLRSPNSCVIPNRETSSLLRVSHALRQPLRSSHLSSNFSGTRLPFPPTFALHSNWKLNFRLQSTSSVAPPSPPDHSVPAPSDTPAPAAKPPRSATSPPNELDDPSDEKSPSNVNFSEVKRLVSLAGPEKKALAAAVGLLCISSSISLSIPMSVGKIIDFFSNPEAATQLPVSMTSAIFILGGVLAIGGLANAGRSALMRIAGERIIQRLRNSAYLNVLKMDMAWFDLRGHSDAMAAEIRHKLAKGHPHPAIETPKDLVKVDDAQKEETNIRSVGDVLSRLGLDTGIVGHALTRDLSDGLRSVVVAMFGVGAMFWISTKLTTVMLLIVPPSAIGAVFYGRFLKKLSRRTQKAYGDMTNVGEERLGNIRTIHSFNAVTPIESNRFVAQVEKIFKLARTEAYANALFFGGSGFAGNLTMLALLTYGGSLVAKGEISVGDLTSLLVYTFYVGSSMVGLTSFFSTIMKGLGAATRVFDLLDAKPVSVVLGEGKELIPKGVKPIRFEDVYFSYPSRPSIPILQGLSLEIQPGSSVAIVGGSGSGKSTIAALVARFYDPVEGKILYDDEDIREFTPESWRRGIAMVPQDPVLFGGTIRENVTYGLLQTPPDSEIWDALDIANCKFVYSLPFGLDTDVGVRGSQLSGGQRQRVAIARALVRKPGVLVLDEAASSQDAISEAQLATSLNNISMATNLTTIIIAHRLSSIKTASRVVMLQEGKICEDGTYENLIKPGTKFRELMDSQLS